MSRGPSGRMVVEVTPELKRRLYETLDREGLTLRDWLIGQAEQYIAEHRRSVMVVGTDPGSVVVHGPRGTH